MHTVTKRLYITADGDRLVEEGDPDAQFLYANPGRKIPDEDAAKFGLIESETQDDDSKKASAEESAVEPSKKRRGRKK